MVEYTHQKVSSPETKVHMKHVRKLFLQSCILQSNSLGSFGIIWQSIAHNFSTAASDHLPILSRKVPNSDASRWHFAASLGRQKLLSSMTFQVPLGENQGISLKNKGVSFHQFFKISYFKSEKGSMPVGRFSRKETAILDPGPNSKFMAGTEKHGIYGIWGNRPLPS